MECKFLNWECASENVGPLFRGIIPLLREYIFSWTFVLILISCISIIFGRIFDGNEEFIFYETIKYDIFGDSLTTIGSAILSGIVVKYLISGNFFAKAISKVIIEKFSSYEFIKDFNEKKIREIVASIVRAHPLIHLKIDEDETQKNKSIEKLEQYFINLKSSIKEKEKNKISLTEQEEFIKDKNYIVMESNDRRTVYRNGLEIIDKNYKIKIMEEGNFLFEYKFQPQFSKIDNLEISHFDSKNNRFSDYSYAINDEFIPKNIGKKRQNYKTHCNFNIEPNQETGEDWFVISFSHKNCYKGDILNLEFSLSLPDEFREEVVSIIKEDTKKAPKSTFSFPHAHRTIIFQKEIYCNEESCFLSELEPTLLGTIHGNGRELDATVSKNMFYKIYEWKLPFVEGHMNQFTLTFE